MPLGVISYGELRRWRVYHRWHQGGFGQGASIFGVVFFGLGAYFAGHYVVTGRHHFAAQAGVLTPWNLSDGSACDCRESAEKTPDRASATFAR